jgi:Family of unknown function (DUF6493)
LSKSQEAQQKEMFKEFEELLAKGYSQKFKDFFAGMSTEERAKYAPTAIRCYKESIALGIHRKVSDTGELGPEPKYVSHQATASGVLLTANTDQLSKISWHIFPYLTFDTKPLLEIQPEGLRGFGSILMEQHPMNLQMVKEWITLGLIDKPDSDAFITAIIGRGMFPYQDSYDWLVENWNMMEPIIWRLFEVEGDRENSLAGHDKFSHINNQWATGIYKLAVNGYISRKRLLRECLNALGRGFIQFRSGWFSRLHEDLKPTVEERIELTESYAQLLGSPIPPTVTFAIKALQAIDQSHPLPETLLERHLSPCLLSQQKAVVTAALSLLERAVKRKKSFSSAACQLAAVTLQHESPEIQSKAINFLKRYADKANETLLKTVSLYREALAPSASIMLEEWLGEGTTHKLIQAPAPTSSDSNSNTKIRIKYAMNCQQLDGWPLKCLSPIEPILNPEELIHTAAYVLEHPGDVIEIERVLDGISRMPGLDDEKLRALAALLKKQISKANKAPHNTYSLNYRLLETTLHRWLEPSLELELKALEAEQSLTDLSFYSFLALRLMHILKRARARISVPLLSAPTHQGGWLDPTVFMQRQLAWQQIGAMPDEYDMAIALLRIPPNSYKDLSGKNQVSPILTKAFLYLSGAGSINENSVSYLEQAIRYAKTPVNSEEANVCGQNGLFGPLPFSMLAKWRAQVAPSTRSWEFAAAITVATPIFAYSMGSHEHEIRDQFELLTESGAPLDRSALTLMNIGLVIGDPECESYARDAMILAIDEGRLDVKMLGREISAFLYNARSKPKRLSKSLAEVARVSDLHADAVRQLIEYTLPGDVSMTPVGLSSLLELLNELLVATDRPLEDEWARKQLELLNKGGKTGALIKQILARK